MAFSRQGGFCGRDSPGAAGLKGPAKFEGACQSPFGRGAVFGSACGRKALRVGKWAPAKFQGVWATWLDARSVGGKPAHRPATALLNPSANQPLAYPGNALAPAIAEIERLQFPGRSRGRPWPPVR